jgi:hypothetical protein
MADVTQDLQSIRIDRTLARYLNIIFAPAPATRKKPRVMVWKRLDPVTKEPVRAQLSILDTFNPTDVRILLALFMLYWQIPADQETGTREFSLQGLAENRVAWNGGHGGDSTPRRLKDALLRLRFNGLLLWNVYRDGKSGELVREMDTFTILDKLSVVERVPLDKHTGLPQEEYADLKSRFRFHKRIVTALECGDIRPMFVKRLLKIDPRAEAALLAALYLDTVMADKTSWERRARALISEDLQLTADYRRPAERKRVLDRIVRHLNDFPVSTGILHLHVKPTNDKTDYKLVVSKTALPTLLESPKTAYKAAEAPKAAPIRETAQKPRKTQLHARTGHPYNLTAEQEGRAEGLALHIEDVIGQPKNRSAYFKLAAEAIRDGYEPLLHRCVGITKEALHDERVTTTGSQFLHDLVKREREKGTEPHQPLA